MADDKEVVGDGGSGGQAGGHSGAVGAPCGKEAASGVRNLQWRDGCWFDADRIYPVSGG